MKKAKVLFTAVAILAVVGTGLAFKAFHPTKTVFCNDANNKCTKLIGFQTAFDNGSGTTDPCGDGKWTTISSTTAACPSNTNTAYPTDTQ